MKATVVTDFDVILGSIAGAVSEISFKCLANYGRFVSQLSSFMISSEAQIGRYDLIWWWSADFWDITSAQSGPVLLVK